ncbi:MAG: sugar ABC transporter ATP-binding protein [Spirochaetaceae bacterium 4572_59]|nr:MAG: sugar ABC transporter ATP-binding protein [Spirochaetaceae bacterium 4572_59]
MSDFLLKMTGVSKEFPGVKALNNVDFYIRKGEVHSLMGENGAGKSTLIKILTGIYTKDSGTIELNGRQMSPQNVLEAQAAGISTIFQELNLIPDLSIAENIFLGREPKDRFGKIQWKKIYVKSTEALKDLGINIDVQLKLKDIGAAIQQMVALVRALDINANLVVMDEPTSSLDDNEVKVLFKVIRNLKERGVSVLFISHRLSEIFEICDRVTILRDGKLVGESLIRDISHGELISKMIGKDSESIVSNKKKAIDFSTKETYLTANGISSGIMLKGIDLSIRKGEIVGLAGLLGSGRTELARVLFGDDQAANGKIEINGKKVSLKHPADAIINGVAFCSEERKAEGIIPNMSVADNITLASFSDITRFGFFSRKKQLQITNKYIKQLSIKTPGANREIKFLSGGNQQKVILARWLALKPDFIILDEPTRGIDVGAKSEIDKLIQSMANEGISILLISSEMEELVKRCDRVAVLYEGEKVGELQGEELSVDAILHTITAGHNRKLQGANK